MPQTLSPQTGRNCHQCFYLIYAFALFFLAFNTAAIAQPDPAPSDTSKKEKQKEDPNLQSSKTEENLHLIMQEGLSESSQLVPVSEEEIEGDRETEQPGDEAEPGVEEEAKETVPPDLETVRRLRLGLAGYVKFWEGWNYKLEVDLTGGESTLSDAYIAYRTQRWGTFRIGNQKVAQTLSGQTSSVSIPFMERPLPVLAFTLQRRLGIGWDTHLRKLGANITVFYKDPNENIGSSGYAGRFYFNPVRFRGDVVHVGASFMNLKLENDGRFRARPESNLTNIRLVDTGVRPNVKKQDTFGLELAGALGPLTIRSEFYSAGWSREFQEDARFDGWYVEGSWFLTGETANYRDGKFIRPVVKGQRGAWEVAMRLSSLDLNDKDVRGGTEDNFSLGINWYSRTHWRCMGNLIKVRSEGPEGKQDPWIVQFRGQYFF